MLGQRADHELMALYAQALRELGRFLGERRRSTLVARRGGSAERLAADAGRRDGDVRRPRLLQARADRRQRPRAGRRRRVRRPRPADDLRRQPRPPRAALRRRARLRRRGWPRTSTPARCCRWAARSARSAPARARLRAARRSALGVAPRVLDNWLWNRGRRRAYKARPRHRARPSTTDRRASRRRGSGRAPARSGLTSGAAALGSAAARRTSSATARSSAPIRLRQAADRVGDRVGQVDPVGVRALRRGARRRAPGGRGCRRPSSSAARRG